MPVTPEEPAPYAPSTAVVGLIERHRNKGLPSPVDAEVLARAGISPSLVARTLQALGSLDLIDAEGKPTQLLEGMRLAPAAEFQNRMVEWLQGAYADALQYVDPATDDETAIRDAFRNYKPVGQQDRMVTLFLGLFRRAGVAPDKTPTGGAARKKATSGASKVRAEKLRGDGPTGASEARGHDLTNAEDAGALRDKAKQPPSDYMAALLAKFPEFDPSWPDEIKAKWFSGFETLMKGVAPK